MEKMREFKELDEEARKEAFDKFVRRQKVGLGINAIQTVSDDGYHVVRTNFVTAQETRKGKESVTRAIPTPMALLLVTGQSPTEDRLPPRVPTVALVRSARDTIKSVLTETETEIIGRGTRKGRPRREDPATIATTMIGMTRTSIEEPAKMSTGLGGKVKLMTSLWKMSMSQR